jgi:hypothetical protein
MLQQREIKPHSGSLCVTQATFAWRAETETLLVKLMPVGDAIRWR